MKTRTDFETDCRVLQHLNSVWSSTISPFNFEMLHMPLLSWRKEALSICLSVCVNVDIWENNIYDIRTVAGLGLHTSYTDLGAGASKRAQWGTVSPDSIRQVSPRKSAKVMFTFPARHRFAIQWQCSPTSLALQREESHWWQPSLSPCCTCPHANVTQLFTTDRGVNLTW